MKQGKYLIACMIFGEEVENTCATVGEAIRRIHPHPDRITFPSIVAEGHKYHASVAQSVHTTYKVASELNAATFLVSCEAEGTTGPTFKLGKLGWFRNKGEDILRFEFESAWFQDCMTLFRRKVEEHPEISWTHPAWGTKACAHITVARGRGLYRVGCDYVKAFNQSTATLRAPEGTFSDVLVWGWYKNGWELLGDDPAKE